VVLPPIGAKRVCPLLAPKPQNVDFPLLNVERPCCDAYEGARSKGKQ